VKVNDDDDNDNDESDYYENSNGVPGEDDLVGVILRTVPPEVSGQFLLHNYSEGMRLWENEDKTDMITSDVTTINVDANTATTVYVEGFDTSTAVRNEKIAVRWTGLPNSDLDTITFTSVWVHLISVQFENDHTIWPDNDGVNPYPKPQWWDRTWPPNGNADDSYDKKYPVCYTRSTATTPSYMTVNVVMIADPPDAFGPPVMYGQGPDGLVFEAEHAATLDDYTFTTNGIVSTALAGTVKYYGGDDILKIKWRISPNGGGSWMNAGTSDNTAYLILENHDPSTYMFETVIDIGCRNANGMVVDATPDHTLRDFTDAIFHEFEDLDVRRVHDSTPMKYWGPYASWDNGPPYYVPHPDVFDTAGLLKNGDGRCGAWMRFFNDCLKAQGIPERDLNGDPATGTELTKITPPIGSVEFRVYDVPAQGNADPQRDFGNHAVLKTFRADVLDRIYDPSYGKGYFTERHWEDGDDDEDGSVEAFLNPNPSPPPVLIPTPNDKEVKQTTFTHIPD